MIFCHKKDLWVPLDCQNDLDIVEKRLTEYFSVGEGVGEVSKKKNDFQVRSNKLPGIATCSAACIG